MRICARLHQSWSERVGISSPGGPCIPFSPGHAEQTRTLDDVMLSALGCVSCRIDGLVVRPTTSSYAKWQSQLAFSIILCERHLVCGDCSNWRIFLRCVKLLLIGDEGPGTEIETETSPRSRLHCSTRWDFLGPAQGVPFQRQALHVCSCGLVGRRASAS